MEAALPLTEAEDALHEIVAYYDPDMRWQEDDSETSCHTVPYVPYGTIFFRALTMDENVPRLRAGGLTLSPTPFRFWFGNMSIEEIQAKYEETEPALFDLGVTNGHSLPLPARDDNFDIGDRLSLPPSDEPFDLDVFITRIYGQFVVDVLGNAPEPREATNSSFLRRTAIQGHVIDDAFRNFSIFEHVAYKNSTTSEWTNSFRWFFPNRSHDPTDVSTDYLCSPYYTTWSTFLQDASIEHIVVSDARRALWERVRSLRWIPDAQHDKMWGADVREGFTRWPGIFKPNGWPKSAPRILLHLDDRPVLGDSSDYIKGGAQ